MTINPLAVIAAANPDNFRGTGRDVSPNRAALCLNREPHQPNNPEPTMSFDAIPHLLADVLQEQKNTNEVLTRLIETLAGLRTKAEGAVKTAKAGITKAATPSSETPTATPTTATAAVVAEAAPAPGIPAPLDYKADVAPSFAKLLTAKGAPAVVAVLAKFGVQKGVELAPAQLADALAAATLALAE